MIRAHKVLAETGGAVSALTPESTLCYANKTAGYRQRKGTPAVVLLAKGEAYGRNGYGYPYPETHCCTATA
jgi:hypothetical protein